MKENMAALAQTMSLFGQKGDDESDTQYNYDEEDDNESYEELGFLAMNVAGRDNGARFRIADHVEPEPPRGTSRWLTTWNLDLHVEPAKSHQDGGKSTSVMAVGNGNKANNDHPDHHSRQHSLFR